MARGQPFNSYAKATFVDLVKGGHAPRSVADDLGFSWRTIKDHIDNDAEFREALEEAMSAATSKIEDRLYREALSGNLGAIKFWLSNRGVAWSDERDRGPAVAGAPAEIAVTVNLVGALREAYAQDDTRALAIDMAKAIPAASSPA